MPVHLLPTLEKECGTVARDIPMSYAVFGALNADRSNAILFPTPFGAQSSEIGWICGADGLFDSQRWCVIVVDTFGNGLSASPFTASAPQDTAWQGYSLADNVNAQRALLLDVLEVDQLALVAGWSIGGQQAYQWASRYPACVARLAVICGSARTAPHNRVFLDAVKYALLPGLEGGLQEEERALRLVGRIYAGWALSQEFYRVEEWRRAGYADLEDFIVRYWEGNFVKRRARNLLAQVQMWQEADISRAAHRGDLQAALGAITADCLVMPCEQDLYFRVEDSRAEVAWLERAELKVLSSRWGHRGGFPAQAAEERFVIRSALQQLLARPSGPDS